MSWLIVLNYRNTEILDFIGDSLFDMYILNFINIQEDITKLKDEITSVEESISEQTCF